MMVYLRTSIAPRQLSDSRCKIIRRLQEAAASHRTLLGLCLFVLASSTYVTYFVRLNVDNISLCPLVCLGSELRHQLGQVPTWKRASPVSSDVTEEREHDGKSKAPQAFWPQLH